MSTRRTTGGVNKVKMGILIAGVFLLFVAFATIWDQTHKKPEPQPTEQTTSANDV